VVTTLDQLDSFVEQFDRVRAKIRQVALVLDRRAAITSDLTRQIREDLADALLVTGDLLRHLERSDVVIERDVERFLAALRRLHLVTRSVEAADAVDAAADAAEFARWFRSLADLVDDRLAELSIRLVPDGGAAARRIRGLHSRASAVRAAVERSVSGAPEGPRWQDARRGARASLATLQRELSDLESELATGDGAPRHEPLGPR